MATKTNPAIHTASRADQRVARQILADLGYSDACPTLSHIAAGPLDHVIRFLAGCRVCFVLIAWDERNRLYAFASPTQELATRLALSVLEGALEIVGDNAGTTMPYEAVLALRSKSMEVAVGYIIDSLHERDVSFIIACVLPGQSRVRFDHAVGADQLKVEECLRWFVPDPLHTRATEVTM